MSNVQERPRLTIAEGKIDPDTRVRDGEITEAEINEFVEALESDEFYDEIASLIPTKCVDGRPRLDGAVTLGANAAGGTFSVVMGDALTTNRYRLVGEKAPQHATHVYEELQKAGHEIGVHDDDHAEGDHCGCGAEDKLDDMNAEQPSILRYMARRGDDIRTALADLGVEIDDETHALLKANAATLVEESYATTGAELKKVATDTAGDDCVETLTGSHKEAALVVQTQEGRTLNRVKLQERFGDKLQAFALDVPALRKAAEITALSPREVEQKFAAMLYYNVATAAVLAGPSLRIVAH